MDVLFTGILAGLALAIPLGPMAILLISTTLRHGRSVGVFGALAMATVDFSYAAVIFIFGKIIIQNLEQYIIPLKLLGSAILIFVAYRIFIQARSSLKLTTSEEVNTSKSKLLTFAKFFGLTILNPATAFYFFGITPSVSSLSNISAFGFLDFSVGVFIGSVTWQFSLVLFAHLTSKFTDLNFQRRLQYLGAALITLLAIWLFLK